MTGTILRDLVEAHLILDGMLDHHYPQDGLSLIDRMNEIIGHDDWPGEDLVDALRYVRNEIRKIRGQGVSV